MNVLQATSQHQKLVQKVERCCIETPHVAMFMNPARDILGAFPIDPVEDPTARSLANTSAEMLDATEVQECIMNLVPPPGGVFQPQYFRSSVFL